ncbi:MAG: o-succinylbenzoate--CoA ligase [Firmicutes bacterium]|nr:o-succinylbenzoate--CoA ligase [Bacillota bacterium]
MQLDIASGQLMRTMARFGIAPGARIAWIGFPSARAVALIHAVMRLGAILVPLDPKLTLSELQLRWLDAQPALLVYDSSGLTVDLSSIGDTSRHLSLNDVPVESSDLVPVPEVDLRRIFALVYTSGTTNRPKGALLRVGNFFWSAVFSGIHMGTHPSDRWLFAMPLFHVSGLSIVFRSVIHGSAIIMRTPFRTETAFRALQKDQVTLASMVPTMLWRLLDYGLAKENVRDLRMILLGGAAASPDLVLRARTSGLPVVTTYGLTETCSQVVTGLVPWQDEPQGSSGRPIPPTVIRIMDARGREMPPGELGEIWVSGPTVFEGYWHLPETTAESLSEQDGRRWLHTKDVGLLDHNGWLIVKDRLTDIIIRGGENISPTEVEHILLSHTAIMDAAVVGLPDIEWGQQVAAAIVTHADMTSQELRSFLRNRLAGYKIPTVYFKMDVLPRTPSGKVQRHLVRHRIQIGDVLALP